MSQLFSSRSFAASEPLESRTLLAALPDWPPVPFSTDHYEGLLYVNQAGYAQTHGKLEKARDVDIWGFQFDDPGNVTVTLRTSVPATLVLYDMGGRVIGTKKAGTKSIGASVSAPVVNKDHFFVGVRGGSRTGTYEISINGVPYGNVLNLPHKPEINAYFHAGALETNEDYDLFQFTATESGPWMVSLDPVAGLDAKLILFNAAGRPIGGTYSAPINKGTGGFTETWTKKNLVAGQQYFIRIGSHGTSAGLYRLRAWPNSVPVISVAAVDSRATEKGPTPGIIRFTRSGGNLGQKLTVRYTVKGTATPGLDYQALSGRITFPANASTVDLQINPIYDQVNEPYESVQVTLSPSKAYSVARAASSKVTIRNRIYPPPQPPAPVEPTFSTTSIGM